MGFIYAPPWRIQGISVGGEQTVIQVPEFGLNFDIGLCPRVAVAAPFTALTRRSHGPWLRRYWFSQRGFVIADGDVFCPPGWLHPFSE